MQRYRVWLVDDREQNRKQFQDEHGRDFDVRVFSTPDEVLRALRSSSPPDALLCDIYFYEDQEKREKIESRVSEEAKKFTTLAAEFGAEDAQLGIGLIEEIRERLKKDFLVYAYTSKGPYLLHGDAFDKLEKLDARWLFKNKYDPFNVRRRIRKDIEEFRELHDWPSRAMAIAWKAGWIVGLITAVIGAGLSVLFDRLAKCWGF